ncbi:MAG: hypothetical protein M3N32_04340 [Actinomycetota bacterium]|nr:hypothetical protein [Actinomycetota bacterium]
MSKLTAALSFYPKFDGVTARAALGLARGQLPALVGYSDHPLIPAVPNLYWFRKEDIDRYLA